MVDVASRCPPLPWKVRTRPERLILLSTAVCGLAGGLFLLLHMSGFDLPVCAWKRLTDLPCAGCGGTRAAATLLRGDPAAALAINPGAVAGLAAAVGLALYACSVLFFRLEPWRPVMLRGHMWRCVLGGLAAANWFYLLLAGRA